MTVSFGLSTDILISLLGLHFVWMGNEVASCTCVDSTQHFAGCWNEWMKWVKKAIEETESCLPRREVGCSGTRVLFWKWPIHGLLSVERKCQKHTEIITTRQYIFLVYYVHPYITLSIRKTSSTKRNYNLVVHSGFSDRKEKEWDVKRTKLMRMSV